MEKGIRSSVMFGIATASLPINACERLNEALLGEVIFQVCFAVVVVGVFVGGIFTAFKQADDLDPVADPLDQYEHDYE